MRQLEAGLKPGLPRMEVDGCYDEVPAHTSRRRQTDRRGRTTDFPRPFSTYLVSPSRTAGTRKALVVIFLSLPVPPNAYPRRPDWHAQMSHFVGRGLVTRYGRDTVTFLPWDSEAELSRDDILVTCLPNRNYQRTRRIVALENDTLRQSRVDSPSFEYFGKTWRVDDIRKYHNWLDGVPAAVIMTNDVALERLARGEPDFVARDRSLRRQVGSVAYTVHPCDKAYFANHLPKRRFRRGAPIGIYHDGWRKNSEEIIAVAREAGLREGRDFDVFRRVRKNVRLELAFFTWRHNVIASGSLSESGPVNLTEFLYQGFHIVGHDEWWPSFGGDLSQFSYDPEKREGMRELLRHLADSNALPEVERERDRILALNLARTDNTWDHYLGLVYAAIDSVGGHWRRTGGTGSPQL